MNRTLAFRAYLFLGPLEAVAAMASFFIVLFGGHWSYGQELSSQDPLYREATMACLGTIVVMQIANVFLCRSASRSLAEIGFGGNRIILAGVAFELLLLILVGYTPWGHILFATGAVPARVWLYAGAFALGMMVLEEFRKRISCRSEKIRRDISQTILPPGEQQFPASPLPRKGG